MHPALRMARRTASLVHWVLYNVRTLSSMLHDARKHAGCCLSLWGLFFQLSLKPRALRIVSPG